MEEGKGDFNSIADLTVNGFSEIVEATKAVNAYPHGSSRDLYCSYPTFGRIIDDQTDRILGLISKVLQFQNVRGNIQCRHRDEQFELIQECNDVLLETVNSILDEMAGIKKAPQTVLVESRFNSENQITVTGKGAGRWNTSQNNFGSLNARLITAKNIERPQIKFKTSFDNSFNSPFIPKLKEKPNSLKPLAILPEFDEDGNIISYLHPYEFELLKFEPHKTQLQRRNPQIPANINSTKYLYIDSSEELAKAVNDLKSHKEIAIDVEHHSYRTFLGFTCLIQISTRDTDYIFDSLKLREDLHVLNEVTTDPKIVKIFHGADMDVEWLQRDLSIYIVNMFDTHQAAKALNLSRLSLQYLLKHYCDIEIDKTFQLADWRIRPLPNELISYARQDTHFLIYIFDRISNDIIDAANQKTTLLQNVYKQCTEICKKRYSKPFVTSDSYMEVLRKSKRLFDNRQLYALRDIFMWRDSVARSEDESYGYVLPNHMMMEIAQNLPREMQGILACCNPIPPLVRQHLNTLHQILLRAREQPLIKPILDTETKHEVLATKTIDYNNKLYCPHDLAHCEDMVHDQPCLLNFSNGTISFTQQKMEINIKLKKPAFGAFVEWSNKFADYKRKYNETKKILLPYMRYLAILPLVEKENQLKAERLKVQLKNKELCPAAQPLTIKEEAKNSVSNNKDLDIPIKKLLKRKYEESVAKKSMNKAKRSKDVKPQESLEKNSEYDGQTTTNFIQSVKKQDNSNVSDRCEELPSTSHASSMKRQQKNFSNKNNAFKSKQNHSQSSNKSVKIDFDYKNVNYKKFQGGAQRAKNPEMKTIFHGKTKSKKINDKKFNKLFTFSQNKIKKE